MLTDGQDLANTGSIPLLEQLEERLLLTTLVAGHFFLYENSKGTTVRVDLIDPPDEEGEPPQPPSMIELFAFDNINQDIVNASLDGTGLVDLPGLEYDAEDTSAYLKMVSWPDGSPVIDLGDQSTDPPTEGTGGWLDFTAADATTDPPTAEVRGARTEIYSIYVCYLNPGAVLSISTIAGEPANEPADGWLDVTPWDGTGPTIAVNNNGEDVASPGSSGGVVIGAKRNPALGENADPIRHTAVGYGSFGYVDDSVTLTDDHWDTLAENDPDFHDVNIPAGTVITAGIEFDPTVTDMGRIVISGTLAGTLGQAADPDTGEVGVTNIDVIETGFFWGKVDIGGNLGTFVTYQGGGAVSTGNNRWAFPQSSPDGEEVIFDSRIIAGGVIGQVWSPSATNQLYSYVDVKNDKTVESPSDVINELEVGTDQMEDPEKWALWQQGSLVEDFYSNDTMQTAQYVSHPSGDFTVNGDLSADTGDSDYYALPLFAGQTITISTDIAFAYLLDSSGRIVDSLGFASGLKTGFKPIHFTAPEADIYYLQVFKNPNGDIPFAPLIGGYSYVLDIQGGPSQSLGGFVTAGDYRGDVDSTEPWKIKVENLGGIGAVMVWGTSYSLGTKSDGDIVAYMAGTVGGRRNSAWYPDSIDAERNIGRIASVGGNMAFIDVSVGNSANKDAFVQNISSAGFLVEGSFQVAGSIGVIDVAIGVGGVVLHVNSDGLGAPGRVDMINVGGDWGGSSIPIQGYPQLSHGPGGDFGFVRIGGLIYSSFGPISPTFVGDGHATTLNDDGGGSLTITPMTQTIAGVRFATAYSYTCIGVEDAAGGIGGAGGIIANVTFYGSATMSVSGVAQVCNVDLVELSTADTITINTSGNLDPQHPDEADIYYLHSDTDQANDGALGSFTNNSIGSVVCGSFFHDVTTIRNGGNIGPWSGTTGAWIHGWQVAPAVSDADLVIEPQYGYFHGVINGLNITEGNLGSLSVNGSLGDLRVEGRIGTAFGSPRALGQPPVSVVVDADRTAPPGRWDGIVGIVWARLGLDTIDVGDGLADFGGAPVARAGIFSGAYIGTVSVSGENYTANGFNYHEIDGCIIAAYDPLGSLQVTLPPDAITNVIGTGGAVLKGWVEAGDVTDFRVMMAKTFTGSVNTVSFSGVGGGITEAFILGDFIRTVATSADSNGINYTTIATTGGDNSGISVGQIIAGGPGLLYSQLTSQGGNFGVIKGLGPVADIGGNYIDGSSGMTSLSGRDIFGNGIHLSGFIGAMSATRDMFSNYNVHAGGIGTIKVSGDFFLNNFTIAGPINSMTVGGDFADSALILQGPTVAYLKSLVVNGDISGTITSAARIGKISSTTGKITADISTLAKGSTGNVDSIFAANGYTGVLDIGGTLKSFICNVSLGDNPAGNMGKTQTFNVWGNLISMKVGIGGKAAPANLYGNLSVGGNIGTIVINGQMFGKIEANGNLSQLTVTGGLGGKLDIDGDAQLENVGAVEVFGTLGSLTIPVNKDIIADITVGGTISSLSLKGGSIVGNITSRYGGITSLAVTDGNISGALTANWMNKIAVTNGDITGNIRVTNGNLTSLTLTSKAGNNKLDANVIVENGSIGTIKLTGASTTTGHDISASSGIAAVTIGGNMGANVTSLRGIGKMTVTGDIVSPTTPVKIWAETGIDLLSVTGALSNAAVRSGGKITKLVAGSMSNSTVSSARDIALAQVLGAMAGSKIVAGYDIGPDMAIGGVDDVLHSGNVVQMLVGGAMTGSVVAAGVGPGADNNYMLGTPGANDLAGGTSTIGKMVVTGAMDNTDGVFAETSIDPAFKGVAGAAGVTVFEGTPAAVIADPSLPNVFGPEAAGTPRTAFTVTVAGGTLTLMLTGAGRASFDSGTNTLVFEHTTASSKLAITYTGTTNYGTITITGADDSALGSLVVGPNVTVGGLTVDGPVGTLQVALAANNAVWSLPGGVKTGKLGDSSLALNLAVTTGAVGTWTMNNAYSGTFTADSVGTFTVLGNSGAHLDVDNAGTITVNGDFTGVIESWGTIGTLNVVKAMSGRVKVYCGDLPTVKIGNGMTGTIDDSRQPTAVALGGLNKYGGGATKSVVISDGNFGSSDSTVFRSAQGVGSFTVSKGAFNGLLSSQGNIGSFTVFGAMTGRAWSGGNISKVTLGSMSEAGGADAALLAASGDVLSVTIKGDMNDSYLFAGFNPGDGGYNAGLGGEAGNLMIDAWTDDQNQSGANADQMAGGQIKSVTIGGWMDGSTISAAVGPGFDGYVGTNDDWIHGTGYIGTVKVRRMINGSGASDESYGVWAASNMPAVTYQNGQPFSYNGNARVNSWMWALAGSLKVMDVRVTTSAVVITFNDPVNMESFLDAGFSLLTSSDETYSDTTDISDQLVVTCDNAKHEVQLTLANGTWDDVSGDTYYRLVVQDTVNDIRYNQLDGDNNGMPGGDFVYEYQRGQVTLAGVHPYLWWFGCAPTSAGMLVAYYDSMAAYANLIPGDYGTTNLQHATYGRAVLDAIASPGDGTYRFDPTEPSNVRIDVPGTPGTGFIPDYGLYDGVDDYNDVTPYPDMSSLNPSGAHANNSIADFMLTARSAEGLSQGGSWPANIGPGVADYINYRLGRTAATSQELVWGQLTFNDYVNEISHGRPVILGVDSSGSGRADHAIIGIGYDLTTRQYECYDTWTNQPVWYDFAPVAYGRQFGISEAIFVNVA